MKFLGQSTWWRVDLPLSSSFYHFFSGILTGSNSQFSTSLNQDWIKFWQYCIGFGGKQLQAGQKNKGDQTQGQTCRMKREPEQKQSDTTDDQLIDIKSRPELKRPGNLPDQPGAKEPMETRCHQAGNIETLGKIPNTPCTSSLFQTFSSFKLVFYCLCQSFCNVL